MEWLGFTEAASYIGFDEKYLKNLVSEKKFDRLPPVYKVGKKYKFEKGQIDDWILSKRCVAE